LAQARRRERDETLHLGLRQAVLPVEPIERLAEIAPACRISRARVVDAGRIVTAGGIASGMEMGFHLLRRTGYDETFIAEVARVMEYKAAYDVYKDDIEYAA
jgi:transcriptional regulator GlxA family with amidase domain